MLLLVRTSLVSSFVFNTSERGSQPMLLSLTSTVGSSFDGTSVMTTLCCGTVERVDDDNRSRHDDDDAPVMWLKCGAFFLK